MREVLPTPRTRSVKPTSTSSGIYSASTHVADDELSTTGKFKGVITDFSHLAEESKIELYVDAERKSKLVKILDQAATDGLPPEGAAKLVGKLRFTLSWTFGRVGMAAIQPLQKRADEWSTQHRDD